MKGSLALVAGTAVLAGAVAAAIAAPSSTAVNPLRVGMHANAGGSLEVIVTNTGRKAARIPSWQLPGNDPTSQLFRVSRDGVPVAYEGKLAKRGLPQAEDFVVLQPGRSYRAIVDLAASYDMAGRGQYQVTLASPLQFASLSGGTMLTAGHGLPMVLKSSPLQVWMEGAQQARSTTPKARPCNPKKQDCGGGGGTGGEVTFVGCSATQSTTALDAVHQARTYSENAKNYLVAGTVGTRYTTWFGAYTSTRYSTAKSHFQSIDAAMDQTGGQVKINCGCNQNYYAYVYPTKPYEIFVCRAFWSAPMSGTDSKGGTLIHEMSHFNVTAGTDDIVYGQSGAMNLAASDPAGALNNADNHEYFAENNPSRN
jgi:peptidyl-Lys metalloendopeptidase